MNIARILYPIEVLGPGKRVGVWTSGCQHNCFGCSNPELWVADKKQQIPVEALTDILTTTFRSAEVDGFTITGGDPFYQPKELSELLLFLSKWTEDILVYTGFTIEELQQMHDLYVDACLTEIAVLIDGPYIEVLNNNCPLRGSSNQRILYLKEKFRPKYESHLLNYENAIQNFSLSDGIISVGIHNKNFKSDLQKKAKERGVIIDGD